MNQKTLILASLLFGSSLSLILSPLIAKALPFSLFNTNLPGVTPDLVQVKTFDLLDFILTLVIAFILFNLNFWALKLIRSSSNFPAIILSLFALTTFLITHFATFSRGQILTLTALAEVVFLALSLIPKIKKTKLSLKIDQAPYLTANGIFLGFYLLLISNKLLTLPLVSIFILIATPLSFLFLGSNLKLRKILLTFPGPLVLASLFFPVNLTYLLVFGVVLAAVWGLVAASSRSLPKFSWIKRYIYPIALIILLTYNPTFYVGNFDPIEEGFLVGWLQSLISGKIPYRDFGMYQPPLIVWGMYLLSLVSGFSIYSERLFLHLMQVLAFVIYFFFTKKHIKNPWAIATSFLIFATLVISPVRNNIEIRVAMGLLGLVCFYQYLQTKTLKHIYLAGIITALSILTSLEVGIVTLVSVLLVMNLLPVKRLFTKTQLMANLSYLGGIITVGVPILGYFYSVGGLSNMISQLEFYSQVFAAGYFNAPIDRAISLSFFHWHIFYQYLSATAFFWEFSKLILFGFLLYLFSQVILHKKLTLNEQFLLTTTIFGLLISRSALGRSDYYHLLMPLAISCVLWGVIIEKVAESRREIASVLIFASLFFFLITAFNSAFLEDQIFKLQTYGQAFGKFQQFDFPRGKGALLDENYKAADNSNLVAFIQSQTKPNEQIFTYPWAPEIYFYADRPNATSFDTPYAFFSENYQQQLVKELDTNKPRILVRNNLNFGGLKAESLPLVNNYLNEHYKDLKGFGDFNVLERSK